MRPVLFTMFVCVVLAAGAAGVAYLAGRSLADAPAAYERGVDEGERRGRAQAREEFARGGEGYTALVAQGRRLGFAEGRRRGVDEGAQKGRARGQQAVFSGFDWDVGRWYLVNMAPGRNGADVSIGSRVELRRERWYGLCAEPSGLCRRSLPKP